METTSLCSLGFWVLALISISEWILKVNLILNRFCFCFVFSILTTHISHHALLNSTVCYCCSCFFFLIVRVIFAQLCNTAAAVILKKCCLSALQPWFLKWMSTVHAHNRPLHTFIRFEAVGHVISVCAVQALVSCMHRGVVFPQFSHWHRPHWRKCIEL